MKLAKAFTLPLAYAALAETPCPSTECWTWDGDAQTCTMVDDCMRIDCQPTAMKMDFKLELFGSHSPTGIKPEPDVNTNSTAEYHFTKTCGLGECGMLYQAVNNNTELEFTLDFTQKGEVRARTDVDSKKIDLGNGIIVETTPFGVGVQFKCTYAMTATVTSDPFSVQTVNISGSKASKGDLSDGFSMALGGGVESALVLGTRQEVTTSWKVTTLSKISFHFDECKIIQDTSEVSVIKNKCYSEALKVTKNEGSGTEQSFSYQTFMVNGASGHEQKVSCILTLCMDACQMPETDDVCPGRGKNDTDLAPYMYSKDGFKKA